MKDKDFEMEDLAGEVNNTTPQTPPPIPKEPAKILTEWDRVLASLDKATEKIWICVPVWSTHDVYQPDTGQIYSVRVAKAWKHAELTNCDGQTFFDWICYVYPPARKMKHSPENYATLKNRALTWVEITNRLQLAKFPVNMSLEHHRQDQIANKPC